MSDGDKGGTDRPWLKVWGAVAALFASVTLGWAFYAHLGYSNQAAYNAEYHDRHAQNEIRGRCVNLPPLASIKCENDARRAAESDQREEYDLEAQRKMSLWTTIMGAMAVAGVSLSGVGVYLIWTTFRETRRAADEARRAADQAEHARISYIERERGHLKFRYSEANIEEDQLSIVLFFRNIGASLAEIDGISADIFDGRVWPSSLSDPSPGMQVKAAAGTDEGVVHFRCAAPVQMPCYFFGFVTYKSLGVAGFRTHFAVALEERDNSRTGGCNLQPSTINNMWIPNDT